MLAKKIVDSMLSWDKDRVAKKRMAWIHFWGPHLPYKDRSASSYVEPFGTNPAENEIMFDYWTKKQGLSQEIFLDDKKKHILNDLNAYDTEVKVVDMEISRLYKELDARGLNKNTLWIITSDHGEGLGSHDTFGHTGSLYEEAIKTSLLIHFSSRNDLQKTIPNPIENVDILPTLCDIFSFEHPVQPVTSSDKSFMPLIENSSAEQPTEIFSWTGKIEDEFNFKSPIGIYIKNRKFPGEKYSLKNTRFKYIKNTLKEAEFYDIASDPLEKNNLLGQGFPEEKILRDHLEARIAEIERTSSTIQPTLIITE